MSKPIRTADGKFNGSIGDGKGRVPTAAPRPQAPAPDAAPQATASDLGGMYSKFQAARPTPPARVDGGAPTPGTTYSRVLIVHRDVVFKTGEHREELIERPGTWEGDTDPATDAIGRDRYPRPTVQGFLPVRAVLIADTPDGGTIEYTVPFDEASREKVAVRAFARRLEAAERTAELRAHSFPADELRRTMKVQVSDGRAITIERISISLYSQNWAIHGVDDDGNETVGYIDPRKPVYVHNRKRNPDRSR